MDDELVLSTSYFNLAGGRRQLNADTFRIEPELAGASPDGTVALYLVTEANVSGQLGARARRRAADVLKREYVEHPELPPPGRLKAAFREAHDTIATEFDGHVAVGMSVMAVEQDTVYLGQVPPAQVYVFHDGGLNSVESRGPEFERALGSSAGPKISIFRDELGEGDVVALCTSWFQQGPKSGEVQTCFEAEDAEAIARGLEDLAAAASVQDATAVVIDVVPESEMVQHDGVHAPGLREQFDDMMHALGAVGRMIATELRPVPLESGASEPRNGMAEEDMDAADVGDGDGPPYHGGAHPAHFDHTSEVPVIRDHTREMPVVDAAEPSPPVEAGTDDEPRRGSTRDQPTEEVAAIRADELTWEVPSGTAPAVPPAEPPLDTEPRTSRHRTRSSPRATPPVSELDQVNSRLQSDPDLGDVIPPIEAFPEASTTEPERIYATSKDIQAVNRRPRRFARKDVLESPPVIRPGVGDLDLRRPVGRPAPPAVIYFSIAAVFALVIAAAVLYLRHRHTVVAVNYPALIKKDLTLATGARNTNQQDLYLHKAYHNLALARASGTPKSTLARLGDQVQRTDDSLHHITRLYSPQLLSDFGKYVGARPDEIAPGPGAVFVLDSGRHSVFSVVPQSTSNPTLVAQRGDTINGLTVGEPQHIATAGNMVLMVDDHNTLVRADQTGKNATSVTKNLPTEVVAAMATSPPDVYVLDPPDNQLWRLADGTTTFNPYGQEFFSPTKPDLSHAVSFVFDSADVYILTSAGKVLKFDIIHAAPQQFALNVQPALQKPVAISTSQNGKYLWIADAGSGRIYQVDKGGTMVRSYVSGSGLMDLHQIKSFAVGPAGNTLYVLCGSKLFQFPVTA